jgi:hypothetical protein
MLPKERAAHSFAVQKTCFPRDHVNRVSLLFHHEPSSLHRAQFFQEARAQVRTSTLLANRWGP